MTHYPETPWNLTPRQQTAMDAFIEHGAVRGAAQAMEANENTVAELLRQARVRMDASSLTMAALMWDRYRRGDRSSMTDRVQVRVPKVQAEKVRELGGPNFLRNLIDEKLNQISQMRPARIEDVWRRT